MIDASILDAMVKAGCSPEQLLAVVKADETAEKERQAERREKTRIRVQKHRARNKSNALQGDVTRYTPLPLEGSPAPLPKNPISPPSSLRSSGDALAREEFNDNFWPAYPHKVGKQDAERAFAKARRQAPLSAMLAGLQAYIDSKPADRPWLNPATWLNGCRWADQPAAVLPNQQAPPRRNGMIAAIERQLQREHDHDGPTIESSDHHRNQYGFDQTVFSLAPPKRE